VTTRIALIITFLIGVTFAAAGLFNSLTDFGIGTAIAAAAAIGYGYQEFQA